MTDRRTFLKGLIGSATIAFVPAASAIEKIRRRGGARAVMVIDLRRCNGCKACVIACGNENGNNPNEHRTAVYQVSHTQDRGVYCFNLPLLCNQCEHPTCVTRCPTGATFKRTDDGVVVVDADKCIGCGRCIEDCPYGGVRFINSRTRKVDKCNFCLHRTLNGLRPACVDTCIGGARYFGDMNDPDSDVARLLDTHETMIIKTRFNTEPNVFYIGLTPEESRKTYSMNFERTWQR